MSSASPSPITLVTGAAGDIGRAVAVRCARDGHVVVVTDIAAADDGLEQTRQQCAEQGAAQVDVRPLDVTDEDGVAAVFDDVAAAIGPPDGVVASAGVQGAFCNLVDQPIDDVRRVMEVNVVGTFAVMRSWARSRIAAGLEGGSFVALASMAGVSGAPNMNGYSTSKAAVLGMVRSAAKDLAPHGMRVNAVSPAFIGPGAMWDRQVELQAETPSQYYADTPDEVARQMIEMVPLRRYGSLEEVAGVVAFLLGEDSSYVTGTNTPISGGSA